MSLNSQVWFTPIGKNRNLTGTMGNGLNCFCQINNEINKLGLQWICKSESLKIMKYKTQVFSSLYPSLFIVLEKFFTELLRWSARFPYYGQTRRTNFFFSSCRYFSFSCWWQSNEYEQSQVKCRTLVFLRCLSKGFSPRWIKTVFNLFGKLKSKPEWP